MKLSLQPVEDAPSDWIRLPLQAIGNQHLERNKGLRNDNLLSLSYGLIKNKDIDSNEGLLPESFETYQLVQPGDIVFRFTDLQNDLRSLRSAIVTELGIITSAYLCFRPNPKKVSPQYLNYLMRAYDLAKVFYAFGGGVRQSLKYDEVRNLPIALPPRAEQDAIVEFLDRELEQIDALIAKNEALVTNLLERRKALIVSLVTFGSPSSKAVPNNWIPQRLRHLATIESGRDYKEVEVFEGGYPIYGSGGEFGRASRYLYSGESVLLGRKGTIDRPLYVNEAFWTVDTMYWTRFKPGVCIKFMYYWATTIPFKMYSTNTALPSMTGADLKNMPIDLPPLDEQIAIATELDKTIQGMDILQKYSEKSVLLLRERRQALIASAVTGKLELQGAR